MISIRRFATVATVLGLAACASGSAGGGGSPAPRRDSNVITAEEVAGANASTAFAIIRQLRPAWLMTRGGTEPIAYVDGRKYATLQDLENIGVELIREIRYLDSRDATMRFGTGHTAGAIEVITRR